MQKLSKDITDAIELMGSARASPVSGTADIPGQTHGQTLAQYMAVRNAT